MDASKAMLALSNDDWHGLAEALADRSMVLTEQNGYRLTIVTRDAALVKVVDNLVQKPGNHHRMEVHQHDTVEQCQECWQVDVDRIQEQRSMIVGTGGNPGVLTVDGILTPAPEGTGVQPFMAMIEQLRGALERSGAMVMVPDDARELSD